MKIYIAGKISGAPGYRKKFAAAADHLRRIGYEPVNPCDNKAKDYKGFIDAGMRMLMECDAIYMLDDWKHSKGARLEQKYAHVTRMKIIYQEGKDERTERTEA